MSDSGGALASVGDGGDGEREVRMGEEDGDVDDSMCRQRGSTGRMKRSQCGERSRVLSLFCLVSGRVGTPAVHRGSTAWSGSDSAGSRAVVAGEEERKGTGTGWREGGVWPAVGSL